MNRAYDYLAESLLRGEVTVPLNSESQRVDGKDFIYFGALPALLRIPLNGCLLNMKESRSRLRRYS